MLAPGTHEFLGMPATFVSRAMLELLERVQRVAQSPAAVLIEGESGSGKEVIARAIHHFSSRAGRPWVDVSCAALPEHLVESELFGYEKGAFSGAVQRKQGLFELADGGTLFLDEIGELDLRLQVKLLRVLDCHEFYRLGGTKKIRSDVRIVAATNQDLSKAVAEGRFRKDLHYRLAQFKIYVPPLRERVEDIVPIAEMLRQRLGVAAPFSPAALDALRRYSWPGNVRELKNAVLACSTACTEVIRVEDLPPEVRAACRRAPGNATDLAHLYESLTGAESGEGEEEASEGGLLLAAEKALIQQVLDQTNGHQERAARILGISVRTLSRKLKMYRLSGGCLTSAPYGEVLS